MPVATSQSKLSGWDLPPWLPVVPFQSHLWPAQIIDDGRWQHSDMSIRPVPAMPSASRLTGKANKTMEIDAAAENAKGERLSNHEVQKHNHLHMIRNKSPPKVVRTCEME